MSWCCRACTSFGQESALHHFVWLRRGDRLRGNVPTSISYFFLDHFDSTQVDTFRATLRVSHSAIRTKSDVPVAKRIAPCSPAFRGGSSTNIKTAPPYPAWRRSIGGKLMIDADALRRGLSELFRTSAFACVNAMRSMSLREEQLVQSSQRPAAPLRLPLSPFLQLQGKRRI